MRSTVPGASGYHSSWQEHDLPPSSMPPSLVDCVPDDPRVDPCWARSKRWICPGSMGRITRMGTAVRRMIRR